MRVDVSADVVAALEYASTLRKIRIAYERNGSTAKTFELLKGGKAMQAPWLGGPRISKTAAAAYAKANAKMYVDINTF